MAVRSPKPCRANSCPALCRDGSGYCEAHQSLTSNWSRTESASSRGYGYQWQKLRKMVLRRDKNLCQMCLSTGRVTIANQVDHIIPKSQGGRDEMGNCQSLCKKCHTDKTAREGGLNIYRP